MVNGADIAIDGIVMVYQYGISMIYIYINGEWDIYLVDIKAILIWDING